MFFLEKMCLQPSVCTCTHTHSYTGILQHDERAVPSASLPLQRYHDGPEAILTIFQRPLFVIPPMCTAILNRSLHFPMINKLEKTVEK